MKTIHKLVLLLLFGICCLFAIPYDFFWHLINKFRSRSYDDGLLSLLVVISIMATALTIFGICYHFDIAGILRDYYWELCRKLTWT